jgi:Glucodextranase, domain B
MPRLAPTRTIARLFVALTAALGLCVMSLYAAPAALATVTQTNITAPANRSVFVYNTVTGEPQVTVTGTAPGASNGDEVNIICTWLEAGSAKWEVMNATTPPAVVTNQAFSYTGSLEKLEGHTCVLRAVPAGAIPTDLSPFTGPQIAIDELDAGNSTPTDEEETIIGGPNSGDLYDYFFFGAAFQGQADYLSMSSCGVCDTWAVDPTTSTLGSDLFFSNAALYDTNIANNRSEVQVDGNNSYASDAARDLVPRTNPTTYDGSEDYEHFPSTSFSANVNPLTGDVSLTEEGSFAHCTGGNPVATHALTHAECPNFAPTGVGFVRRIFQNEDGALATVRDTFFSTDNQPHQLDLLYYQSVHTPNSALPPGYRFTWLPGGFETPAENATITPPSGPATILAKAELHQADGDQSLDQGAMVLSAPPSEIAYGKDPGEFELHYVRTIPAGGSVTISQAFATAFLLGEAETLGQRALASFAPTVAISSPTTGSTVSSPSVTVSGSVGAGGNGLPATISVNGQTVPVAASGAWSAAVPLVAGANTITATTTDAYGLQGSAQTTVTYAPPSRPPAKATASIVKAFYNGKVLALTIACKAGGANCEGSVRFTAKLKVKVKPHNKHKRHFFLSIKTVNVSVTSGNFSIPAGQTKTLLLKLSKTATGIITSTGRLKSTLTLSLRQPNHLIITVTRSTVLLRNIKSHNKHKGHKH